MKDEGDVPGKTPSSFIIHPSSFGPALRQTRAEANEPSAFCLLPSDHQPQNAESRNQTRATAKAPSALGLLPSDPGHPDEPRLHAEGTSQAERPPHHPRHDA